MEASGHRAMQSFYEMEANRGKVCDIISDSSQPPSPPQKKVAEHKPSDKDLKLASKKLSRLEITEETQGWDENDKGKGKLKKAQSRALFQETLEQVPVPSTPTVTETTTTAFNSPNGVSLNTTYSPFPTPAREPLGAIHLTGQQNPGLSITIPPRERSTTPFSEQSDGGVQLSASPQFFEPLPNDAHQRIAEAERATARGLSPSPTLEMARNRSYRTRRASSPTSRSISPLIPAKSLIPPAPTSPPPPPPKDIEDYGLPITFLDDKLNVIPDVAGSISSYEPPTYLSSLDNSSASGKAVVHNNTESVVRSISPSVNPESSNVQSTIQTGLSESTSSGIAELHDEDIFAPSERSIATARPEPEAQPTQEQRIATPQPDPAPQQTDLAQEQVTAAPEQVESIPRQVVEALPTDNFPEAPRTPVLSRQASPELRQDTLVQAVIPVLEQVREETTPQLAVEEVDEEISRELDDSNESDVSEPFGFTAEVVWVVDDQSEVSNSNVTHLEDSRSVSATYSDLVPVAKNGTGKCQENGEIDRLVRPSLTCPNPARAPPQFAASQPTELAENSSHRNSQHRNSPRNETNAVPFLAPTTALADNASESESESSESYGGAHTVVWRRAESPQKSELRGFPSSESLNRNLHHYPSEQSLRAKGSIASLRSAASNDDRAPSPVVSESRARDNYLFSDCVDPDVHTPEVLSRINQREVEIRDPANWPEGGLPDSGDEDALDELTRPIRISPEDIIKDTLATLSKPNHWTGTDDFQPRRLFQDAPRQSVDRDSSIPGASSDDPYNPFLSPARPREAETQDGPESPSKYFPGRALDPIPEIREDVSEASRSRAGSRVVSGASDIGRRSLRPSPRTLNLQQVASAPQQPQPQPHQQPVYQPAHNPATPPATPPASPPPETKEFEQTPIASSSGTQANTSRSAPHPSIAVEPSASTPTREGQERTQFDKTPTRSASIKRAMNVLKKGDRLERRSPSVRQAPTRLSSVGSAGSSEHVIFGGNPHDDMPRTPEKGKARAELYVSSPTQQN